MIVMIKTLTEQSFGQLLSKKSKIKNFVVLFVPQWSKTDYKHVKTFEQVSEVLKTKANFYTFDIQSESPLVSKYMIREVPTLYIFDNENTVVAYTLGNYGLEYLLNFVTPSV